MDFDAVIQAGHNEYICLLNVSYKVVICFQQTIFDILELCYQIRYLVVICFQQTIFDIVKDLSIVDVVVVICFQQTIFDIVAQE